MQYEFLDLLKCPLTKTELQFQLISEFKKEYSTGGVNEIYQGLLFSQTGFVFPVIDGIPRMLIESIYDYKEFLKRHLSNYEQVTNDLEKRFAGLLSYCSEKNSKTKESFDFEWSFLNVGKGDKVWHSDQSELSSVLREEVGEKLDFFSDKTVIDVGSGHGLMTIEIAQLSRLTVGVELSKAVENAYSRNRRKNAWYAQADLEFLPFSKYSFDTIYCSGVIHHTPSTELSLSLIEPTLKKEGKICLWLYHPQNNVAHRMSLHLRSVTSLLPLRLVFILMTIFIFPFTFLIKRIRNRKPPNYREEMIDLLDGMTPQYRFEVPHDLATIWLQRRGYQNIKITTSNQYGFSISADKKE
jgi:SAM-dependent methyltransferase